MEQHSVYPHSATLFAAICALILAVIGILGNILTILALLKYPKTRGHVTTAFVVSLSFSDLFFCAFSLPLTSIRFYMESWIFGQTMCKMFPVIFYGNIGVSLFSMAAITINRYVYVIFQRYYTKIYRNEYIIAQLLFVWIVPFLFFLPVILELNGQTGLNEATFSCTILRKDGKSFKNTLFLTGFLLTCLVIIICYACIYLAVVRQRKKLQRHDSCTTIRKESILRRRNSEENNRLTIMMATIFGCFLLCFLPSVLINLLDSRHQAYSWCHIVTSIMTWASNVLNPIVYALSNQNYRNAYYKALNMLKFWRETTTQSQSGVSKDFSTYRPVALSRRGNSVSQACETSKA